MPWHVVAPRHGAVLVLAASQPAHQEQLSLRHALAGGGTERCPCICLANAPLAAAAAAYYSMQLTHCVWCGAHAGVARPMRNAQLLLRHAAACGGTRCWAGMALPGQLLPAAYLACLQAAGIEVRSCMKGRYRMRRSGMDRLAAFAVCSTVSIMTYAR